MTITETNPSLRNGVDTSTLFATLDAVKQSAGGGTVPVPRSQRMDERHTQPFVDQ